MRKIEGLRDYILLWTGRIILLPFMCIPYAAAYLLRYLCDYVARYENAVEGPDELKNFVELGRKCLGIADPVIIVPNFENDFVLASEKTIEEAGNPYYILWVNVDSQYRIKRSHLCHELYHIVAGHCDREFQHCRNTGNNALLALKLWLDYYLYQEISACCYELRAAWANRQQKHGLSSDLSVRRFFY